MASIWLELADALLDAGVLALTCHSEGWEGGSLSEAVRECTGLRNIEAEKLTIAAEAERGNSLSGGWLLLGRK